MLRSGKALLSLPKAIFLCFPILSPSMKKRLEPTINIINVVVTTIIGIKKSMKIASNADRPLDNKIVLPAVEDNRIAAIINKVRTITFICPVFIVIPLKQEVEIHHLPGVPTNCNKGFFILCVSQWNSEQNCMVK